MKITTGFEHDFDTLVTRGKLRVISLREIVDGMKKHTVHTESQEFKRVVNQIDEKVDSILQMFSNIPKSESLEFTQLFCFQLRRLFKWKTVQWEYSTEDSVTAELKEMSNQAQTLANLYGTKVRLIHVVGESTVNVFKSNKKSYKILGVYNPVIL